MSNTRSKWKGPVLKNNICTKKSSEMKYSLPTYSRSSLIMPKCIGKTFLIHNGKDNNKIVVTSNMIGFKFGEFCPTRATFKYKK